MKAELNKEVADDIIEPVTKATDWVHHLVMVPKSKGRIRLCVNLQKLNQYVKRLYYPTRSPTEVLSNIALVPSFSPPWMVLKDTREFPWKKKAKF